MRGEFSRFTRFCEVSVTPMAFCLEEHNSRHGFDPQKLEKRYCNCAAAPCRPVPLSLAASVFQTKPPERPFSLRVKRLVLLFASLLAVPLARQSCLDATLLAGLQIVGVTLHFLDDVLLLYLPLEPAQRIFQRFAFLNANLSQGFHLQTCLKASLIILELGPGAKPDFFLGLKSDCFLPGRPLPPPQWMRSEFAPGHIRPGKL